MKKARYFSIGLLLLSLAYAALPASADEGFSSTGGTQVSVEGSLVTITVSIDLALGGQGETTVPEGAQADADGVAQQIADYWNQGFERLSSPCVQFKLVVKINVVPQADAHLLFLGERRATWVTTPGRHVVFWGEDNFGNAAPPETYDEYDEDGIAPPGEDYGAPLDHELWSIWSPHLESARDFAHELGHLMGFGDDYANGEPLPGREGTLMDNGDLVDQNLVNRLADIARNSGKRLPECWEGTAKSTITTPSPNGSCGNPTHTEAAITLVVGGDGSVKGEYDVTGCGVSEPHAEWTGTATDAGFLFPRLVVFTNGSLVPKVSPTRARATLTNIQGTTTWVTTWDLTCKTCDE
jgi:hypothetical protein